MTTSLTGSTGGTFSPLQAPEALVRGILVYEAPVILKKGASTSFRHRGGPGNIWLGRDKQPVPAEVRNPSSPSFPPSLHYVACGQ